MDGGFSITYFGIPGGGRMELFDYARRRAGSPPARRARWACGTSPSRSTTWPPPRSCCGRKDVPIVLPTTDIPVARRPGPAVPRSERGHPGVLPADQDHRREAHMSERMPLLQPIRIGAHTAANRIAINAMECCDADTNGNPTETAFRRYERLARGNAGMIVVEALSVVDENRGRLHQLTALPQNQKGLTDLVALMRKTNPKPLIVWQLTHSGELSSPEFSERVCVKPFPGVRGTPPDRRGDGRDPRPVRGRREDGARLRRRRGGLQALPRLPRHAGAAAVQRPEVEVRRIVGQPHPVRLRVLRAGGEGDQRPELPRRLEDLDVGRPAGRHGLGRDPTRRSWTSPSRWTS